MRTDEPELPGPPPGARPGARPGDPSRGDLAAFFDALRRAYPPAPVDAVREQHLAAVSREVGAAGVRPRPEPGRRARRTVVAAVAAALGLLSVGSGVATALGGNPLQILPGLRLGPPETPRSAQPGPGTTGGGATATPPAGPPGTGVRPTTAPKTPPGRSAQAHGKATGEPGDNGNASAAQASHNPTARSTQAEGKPTPPAKGRPSAPPGHASTGGEDRPGG